MTAPGRRFRDGSAVPRISDEHACRCIDTYIGAWNEPDPDRRHRLLIEVMTPNAVYCDPVRQIDSRNALADVIGELLKEHPERTIVRTSNVDVHHLVCRFNWQLIRADGSRGSDCVDFVEFTERGEISRITGFFGSLGPVAGIGTHA